MPTDDLCAVCGRPAYAAFVLCDHHDQYGGAKLVPIAATPAPLDVEYAELRAAFDMMLVQRQHDAEVIERLTRALRVSAHSPHDQDGEPIVGFPVCSVCGAIQTTEGVRP
jgi:hypothetical protein